MVFDRLANFFRGSLRIRVEGCPVEKFLNICTYHGMEIRNVHKLENGAVLQLSWTDWKEVRRIAKDNDYQCTIITKRGLPVTAGRMKKRYFFIAGLLCCGLFFAASAQFIWAIEVNGNETISAEEILEDLESVGFKEGVYKNKFDLALLKEEVLLRNDKLAWIWVDIVGNKAVVNVKEKSPIPEMVPDDVPCDIIAQKMGIIQKKVVKNGRSMIEVGDTVFPGDLLVAGTIDSETEGVPTRLVHASGEVYARTWYEKTGEFTLTKEYKVYTGREQKYCRLKLYGYEIPLSRKESNPYAHFDVVTEKKDLKVGEDHYLGISLIIETVREYEFVEVPMSLEDALEKAQNALRAEIEKELSLTYEEVKSDFTYEMAGEDTIVAKLKGEFIEQIGITQPFESGVIENNGDGEDL